MLTWKSVGASKASVLYVYIDYSYKLFYNIVINCCYSQLLTGSHLDSSITSFFLFIYNYLPHHHFVKVFVKEFVYLAFSLTNIYLINYKK